MKGSSNNDAIALLTLHLGSSDERSAKPISAREWSHLAQWLDERRLTPSDLVTGNPVELLEDWDAPKVDRERLLRLLDRGYSLGTKLVEWLDGHGLQLASQSDPHYPRLLRTRLGEIAPPILFLAGRMDLLENPGFAIVGSRKAASTALDLARRYGETCSDQGFNVISGGAKGVDSAATEGALVAGGTAITVVGDSLIQATRTLANRSQIQHGNLLLLTPFAPDAGFSAGNAMARNKLIYCLADAAIVVASESGKGGTFAGATEALRAKWLPVGLVRSDDPQSGYPELLQMGGIALSSDASRDLELLLTNPTPFEHAPSDIPIQARLSPKILSATITPPSDATKPDIQVPPAPRPATVSDFPGLLEEFVRYWRCLNLETTTPETLADRLHLQKTQVQAWLKTLHADGRVEKSRNPVRYTLIG